MFSPHECINALEKTEEFKKFKEQQSDAFLSHFFTQISAQYSVKTNWDAGYYEPKQEKIVVFTQLADSFVKKAEDEVFKKKADAVEPLKLDSVSVSFEKAVEITKKKIEDEFSQLQLGDGFVILQELDAKPLWNFTFITRTLQFLNIKINASTGIIESAQAINAVEQQ